MNKKKPTKKKLKTKCPSTLPKPLPGCPGPSESFNESEITGMFFHPVGLPPIEAKDWQYIKFPEGGLKSGGLVGKPTIKIDFGNIKDPPTEFICKQTPGGPEVFTRELTMAKAEERMGDMFLGAVDHIKERRKKIDQIDRAIRLINTAESTARAVTRAAMIIQGKPFDPHPMEDDYRRAHESMIETLLSQKSYLEMLNNTQSIDGGQRCAPEPVKEWTYENHLTMFIRNLLNRIDELEEARQAQMATIERGGAALESKDREVQEYIRASVWEKTGLQRKIESLEVEVKSRISDEEKHKAEVAALNKTIAGLRSAITRMGGKTRPPRKRKK